MPSEPTRSVLRVAGISKAFAGTKALSEVDFEIHAGERVAVMGENGAGKSTLMKVFAGVHRPDHGVMLLEGEDYSPRTPIDAIRAGVNTVYQEPSGFGHLTVLENLFMGRQHVRPPFGILNKKSMEGEAVELLERLTLPASLLKRQMGRLSIAEQQQVLIARAVSNEAKLLILDEPTSILTAGEAERLFELIDSLSASGTAICYITHRFDELERTADRFVVLKDGRNAGQIDVPDKERLLRMMGSMSSADLVQAEVGNEKIARERAARSEEPVISVSGLGSAGLFDDVSFEIHPGQIVGLYGLVGAGRTEVALSIFGEMPVNAGSITYRGAPFGPRSARDSLERGIAYLPEDRKSQGIFQYLTLSENLVSAVLGRIGGAGLLSNRKENGLVSRWAERLSIKSAGMGVLISSLSGGNQQKVLLARLIATEPKLLLLDEPTRGIDVATKHEIHRDIRQLADDGMAVLLISSELGELLELSEEVHVLHEGRVSATLVGAEITEESVLRAAVGVTS